MATDNISKLYKAFSAKYNNFKDEDEFRNYINTADALKMQKLYDAFSAKYNNFENVEQLQEYVGWSGANSQAQTPAQTPAAPEQTPAQTPAQTPELPQLSPTPSATTAAAQKWEEAVADTTAAAQSATMVKPDTIGRIGGRAINPETGRMEAVNDIESATDPMGYMGREQKLSALEQLKERQAEIDRRREEIKQEKDEIESSKGMNFFGRLLRANAYGVHGAANVSVAAPGQLDTLSKQYGERENRLYELNTEERMLNRERLKIQRALENDERHGFWANAAGYVSDFFVGAYDTLTSPYTYSFGFMDWLESDRLKEIHDKLDRGESLTEFESNILKAEGGRTKTEQIMDLDDAPGTSFIYGFGEILGEAIPFMIELYLSGGTAIAGTIAGFSAKQAAKIATRQIIKKAAKEGVQMTAQQAARQALTKPGLMQKAIQYTGTGLGEFLVGSYIANTTGAASTWADINKRQLGSVIEQPDGSYAFGHYDDDGNFVAGGESFGAAFFKGQMAAAIENYTELLGGHLAGGLNKATAKLANRYGLSKIGNMFARQAEMEAGTLADVRWGDKLLSKVAFNGYMGESLEEEASIILNSMLVGDNKFSDLWDAKTQIDIWGGMIFTTGAMEGGAWTLNKAGRAYGYRKARKGLEDAESIASMRLTEEVWAPMRESIDSATNEEMTDVVADILSDASLNEKEKEAAVKYAQALIKFRGFNQGTIIAALDNQEYNEEGQPITSEAQQVERALDKSYTQGYEGYIRPELITRRALHAMGATTMDEAEMMHETWLGGMTPAERLAQMREERAYTKEIDAALERSAAMEAYRGMRQSIEDTADSRDKALREKVSQATHVDGSMRMVTLKDGSKAYVIAGELAQDIDGNIDQQLSSDVISVYDPESGNRWQTNPSDVASIDAYMTAAEVEEELQSRKANHIQTMLERAMGEVDLQIGATVNVGIDEQGNYEQVQIAGIDGDNVTIVDGEGKSTTVTSAELQAMADAVLEKEYQTLAAEEKRKKEEEIEARGGVIMGGGVIESTESQPIESQPSDTQPIDASTIQEDDEVVIRLDNGVEMRALVSIVRPDGSIRVGYRDREGESLKYVEIPADEIPDRVLEHKPSAPMATEESGAKAAEEGDQTVEGGTPKPDVLSVPEPTTEELIAKARQGDELARHQLEAQGIEWGEPTQESAPESAPEGSALSRVPRNEENGDYDYLAVDAQTAFDAITEQVGEPKTTVKIVNDMVETLEDLIKVEERNLSKTITGIEKEIDRLQSGAPQGMSLTERIAYDKQRSEAIKQKKAEIDAAKGKTAQKISALQEEINKWRAISALGAQSNEHGTLEEEIPFVKDKKGNNTDELDWLAVSPERGYRRIYDESPLPDEQKDKMVEKYLADAKKKLEKLKPKEGKTLAESERLFAEYQAEQKKLEDAVAYWEKVKALREAVKAEELADKLGAPKVEGEQVEEVGQAIKDRWANTRRVVGKKKTRRIADGTKLTGHWEVVEAGAATSSHDPDSGYKKSEGYPTDVNGNTINDRDYERDVEAQQHTEEIAQHYNESAIEDPVIVSQDGIVLSGNGRNMAGNIAAKQGTDQEYVDYLKENASDYGIDADELEKFEHPRLVFVADEAMPYDTKTMARFNRSSMKSQAPEDVAVKMGKLVSDATYASILNRVNQHESMSDFYADTQAVTDTIGDLISDGVFGANEKKQYVNADGNLTEAGKEMLEQVIIGKAFESDPDAVYAVNDVASMRRNVIKALSEINKNKALGREWGLEDALTKAIHLAREARLSRRYKEGDKVSGFAGINSLDPETQQRIESYRDPLVLMLADMLNNKSHTLLKKVLSLYNEKVKDAAAGQLTMLTEPVESRRQALEESLTKSDYDYGSITRLLEEWDALRRGQRTEGQRTEGRRAEGGTEDGATGTGTTGSTGGGRPEVGTGGRKNSIRQKREGANDARDVSAVVKLANALGRKIVFDGHFIDEEHAGYLDDNGVIHINPNMSVDEQLSVVIGHELTHTAEDTKAYEKLVEFLKNNETFKKWLENKGYNSLEEYAQKEAKNRREKKQAIEETAKEENRELTEEEKAELDSLDLTEEEAEKECIADFCGEMVLSDRKFTREMLSKVKETRSIIERIIEAIREFLNRIGIRHEESQMAKDLRTISEMLTDALREARELENRAETKPRNNVYTYWNKHTTDKKGNKKSGRELLAETMKENGKSNKEINRVLRQMDELAKLAETLGEVYPQFNFWNETEPVVGDDGVIHLSCVVRNAEYPMNIDFSIICKKKEAATELLDYLMAEGDPSIVKDGKIQLNKDNLRTINNIVKKRGFEIACDLCFVEAKRFGMSTWANSFIDFWNPLVKQAMVAKLKAEGKLPADYNAEDFSMGEFNFRGSNEAETAVDESEETPQEILDIMRRAMTDYIVSHPDEMRTEVEPMYDFTKDENGKRVVDETRIFTRRHPLDEEGKEIKGVWEKVYLREKSDGSGFEETGEVADMPSKPAKKEYATYKGKVKGNGKGKAKLYADKPIVSKMVELLSDPHQGGRARKMLNAADLVSHSGMDGIINNFYDLYKIVNIHGGVSKPKSQHGHSPYVSAALTGVSGVSFSKEKAFHIGGVRNQSFSDYEAMLWFDYMQLYADMAALGMPMQVYTKEPAYARLFGMMGSKINLSLLCQSHNATVNLARKLYKNKNKSQLQKKVYNYLHSHAGLYPVKGAALDALVAIKKLESTIADMKPKDALTEEMRALEAQLDKLIKDDNLDEWEYNWGDQTFPMREAFDLISDPQYSANLGTILVGVSDKMIEKALADPRIKMIIPYHKSGLPEDVALSSGVFLYKDYTKWQSDKKIDKYGKSKAPKINFYDCIKEVEARLNGRAAEGIRAYERKSKNAWHDPEAYKQRVQEVLDMVMPEGHNYTMDDVPMLAGKLFALNAVVNDGIMPRFASYVFEHDGSGVNINKKAQEPHLSGVVTDENGIPKFSAQAETYFKKIEDFNMLSTEADENGDVHYRYQPQGSVEFKLPERIKVRGEGWTTSALPPINESAKINVVRNGKLIEKPITELIDEKGEMSLNDYIASHVSKWEETHGRLRTSMQDMSSDVYRMKALENEIMQEHPDWGGVKLANGRNELTAALSRWSSAGSLDFSDAESIAKAKRAIGLAIKNAASLDNFSSSDEAIERLTRQAELKGNKKKQRNSFIGKRGASNLDASQEATTRMDNLAMAREMESEGKEARAIRMATGWERGADGKWRYEVPDLILPYTDLVASVKEGLSLTEVVSEELAEAYPQLRDWHLKFDESFSADNGETITMATTIPSEKIIRFSHAGLLDASYLNHLKERINTLKKEYKKAYDEGEADMMEALEESLKRQQNSYDDESKRLTTLLNKTLVHEIQHVIQEFEGFAKGGIPYDHLTPLTRRKLKGEKLKSLVKEIEESERQSDEEFAKSEDATLPKEQRIAALKRSNELVDMSLGVMKELHYEAYRNVAGEVEARNASTRMDYSDEKRRETLLEDTEDVSRDDQIFLRNNLGASESREVRDVEDLTEEERDIVEKAKANGTYMKAPNGKPTNLDEKQWAQVRTEAFKEWFGDWEQDPENSSKILDENGEPMVINHVTDGDFSVFDNSRAGQETSENASNAGWAATAQLGHWFNSGKNSLHDYYQNRIDAYLSLQTPKIYGSIEEIVSEMGEYGDTSLELYRFDTVEQFREYTKELANPLIEQLQSEGYDGIVVKDEELGGTSYVAFYPNQIKSATENNGEFSSEKDDIRYRILGEDARMKVTESIGEDGRREFEVMTDPEWSEVKDKELIKRLESGKKRKAYAAMVMDEDGNLYPPMSSKEGKGKMRKPSKIGKWEESEERPDKITKFKKVKGREIGVFTLIKDNGKTVPAAYNPYFHQSDWPLNDQFSSAWSRKNIVVVEVEIPESEMEGSYQAKYAKDPTGLADWKDGGLTKSMGGREVYLSRWRKPVKILEDAEVASLIAPRLKKYGKSVPFNVVTPGLREALIKEGVKISKPEKGAAGDASIPSWEEFKKSRASAVANENRSEKSKVAAAQALAEKLGKKVRIITDVKEIKRLPLYKRQSDEHKAKMLRSQGWMDRTTGEVVVVIPNNRDVADVKKTVLHEAVGHYGLQQLVGLDNFRNFLTEVFKHADADVRAKITDLAKRRGWDYELATEEYIASLAERGFDDMNEQERGLWAKIKELVQKMLDKLMSGDKLGEGVEVSENDIRYMLWRSYKLMESRGGATAGNGERLNETLLDKAENVMKQRELGVGAYDEDALRFRDDDAFTQRDLIEIAYDSAKDAINAMGYKRETDAQKLQAGRDAVARYIRKALAADNIPAMKKMELNTLLSTVKQVRNRRELEKHLRKVEGIMYDIDSRAERRAIDALLGKKLLEKNADGVRVGKTVDDNTRKVLEAVKGRLATMKKTEVDTELHELGSEAYKLRSDFEDKFGGYKAWMENFREQQEQANTTPADWEAEYNRLSGIGMDWLTESEQKELMGYRLLLIAEEQKRLKEEQEALRAEKAEEAYAEMEARMRELEDLMSDTDHTFTEEEAGEYGALKLLTMLTEATLMETVGVVDATTGQKSESIKGVNEQRDKLLFDIKQLRARRVSAVTVTEKQAIDRDIEQKLAEVENLDVIENSIKEKQNDLYRESRRLLRMMIESGHAELQRQIEEEADRRREIAKDGYEDIKREGKKWIQHDKSGKKIDLEKRGKVSSIVHKVFGTALDSFDYMSQIISTSQSGQGYIYRRFMEGDDGLIAAHSNHVEAMAKATAMLDKKCKEMFGKDFKHVGDQYSKVEQATGIFYYPEDKDGNPQRTELPCSKGSAMYIYQLWQMKDGRMKLAKMGFTEDSIAEIETFLGGDLIDLANWMVTDYYPQLRERMNARHKEMYYTSMAEVENYVPIHIDKTALAGKSDMAEGGGGNFSESLKKKNGSIVNRTVNVLPIDLSRTAFDVLAEHTDKNEEWIAYARVRQDLDYLLNSKSFRNQLNANTRGRLAEFEQACRVAALMPERAKSDVDDAINMITAGMAAGAISFKVWTALKQILSYPAFFGYSQDPMYMTKLVRYFFNFAGNYKWAIKNLPSFQKRIEEGLAASSDLVRELEGMSDSAFKRFLSGYSKKGMIPNKLVDAITCAAGARAIYELEYKRAIKNGATPEDAREVALRKADIAYNQTQQSNVSAMKSAAQVSTTAASKLTTLFQQANIGYTRKTMLALNDIIKGIKDQKRQVELRMTMFGETEAEAKKKVFNNTRKAVVSVGLFGFALKILWDKSPMIFAALMSGFMAAGSGDDEEDMSLISNLMLYSGYLMQGTMLGNFLHDWSDSGYDPTSLITGSQFKNLPKIWEEYGVSKETATQALIAMLDVSGMKPETWQHITKGTGGFFVDVWREVTMTAEELEAKGYKPDIAMDVAMALNMPRSMRKELIQRRNRDYSPLEYAEAMAYAMDKRQGETMGHMIKGTTELTDKNIKDYLKDYESRHVSDESKDLWEEFMISSQLVNRRNLKGYKEGLQEVGIFGWEPRDTRETKVGKSGKMYSQIESLCTKEMNRPGGYRPEMVERLLQLKVAVRNLAPGIVKGEDVDAEWAVISSEFETLKSDISEDQKQHKGEIDKNRVEDFLEKVEGIRRK